MFSTIPHVINSSTNQLAAAIAYHNLERA